ncbi:MAG: phosphate ABC transporter permease PstA [Planctomycetes bacterium]|nr:phosphate ABC transporter permease PstA [Planctomycetota bacterium]
MTSRDAPYLLRQPAPEPVGRLALRSLAWSLVVSTCVAGGVALISLLTSLDQFDVLWSLLVGARAGLLALAPAFLGRLFFLSRSVADRGFAWIGLLATFFGLGILLVFFAQLGFEAIAWFRVSPELIEEHNRMLRETGKNYIEQEKAAFFQQELPRAIADEERKLKKRFADDPAILARKLEEARQEIRQEFEEALPERMETWAKNAQEKQIEKEKGIRTDTSPGALLENFLTQGPGDVGQDAGIFPALLGSLWMAIITICLAVPIGVGAAVYLEEYKQGGWLGHIIQVNINNLAGVPSVVYGILGGFVFVEMIFKPMEQNQAAALAELALNPAALTFWDRVLLWLPTISARNVLGGGMTLALLTLPVIIVSAQEAIRAVPPSIRQGAYALGATRWQVIWHQVLPLARPGIMTGTILAVARAIGEAAPLILFGALLLVQQNPSLFSQFTVMPMQIFGWADRPGKIWHHNAGMASILLLIVLLGLNAVAIVLRNRAQRKMRW